MIEEIKLQCKELMEKSIDNLKHQFTKIRTGRASASVLDGVKVDYYGSATDVNQVGQVSTPEARLLQIQPFDKTMIAAIEKAILGANLGLTPSNDGNLIRIPFPTLTEERRKQQVKDIKKYTEESRVSIRNVRRDKNEIIKKSEKSKEISEDITKVYLLEIQKITDSYISNVDTLSVSKEKELLTL